MHIKLQHVHYIPKELFPGVLYVSEEFETAAHLCACGCGSKIRTPLDSTEWSIEETDDGPSLCPSVGNWQQNCRSHYLIHRGEVIWYREWTPEQITAGRSNEERRRCIYYDALDRQRGGVMRRFWRLGKKFFRR